ncbi:MAG: hypothetical protein V5A14_04195 [Desulfohalobiaceae bacterium]
MTEESTLTLQELSQKLDTVVDISREARKQGEVLQDLVRDLNLVSNTALESLQEELELENVQLDGRDVRELLVLILKNIHNFNYTLRQLESVKDLVQELNKVSNSAIMKLQEELDAWNLDVDGQDVREMLALMLQNGKSFKQMAVAMDQFLRNLPEGSLERFQSAAPELAEMTAEIASPENVSGLRGLVKKRKLLVPALAIAWIIPVALLLINLAV